MALSDSSWCGHGSKSSLFLSLVPRRLMHGKLKKKKKKKKKKKPRARMGTDFEIDTRCQVLRFSRYHTAWRKQIPDVEVHWS